MRLLIVTQYFWPENFRINELVADLCSKGHELTVLTGLPNYPEGIVFKEFLKKPERFNEYQGARVVRVPVLPRGETKINLFFNYLSFCLSASCFGLWKLRRQEFDAIFVYQTSPVTVAIPAVIMRAVKRVPLALWVLDIWPDTLKAVGVIKSQMLIGIIGRLVSWIYRRCDLILVQSKSFTGNISRYAHERSWIEYFPAWADDVFLSEKTIETIPEIPAAPGVFTILFAGNIGEAQDFPAILNAAEILKERDDIRWIIVGDGRKSKWVSSQLHQRKLIDKVLMLGRHPLESMPGFFAHADVLLVSLKDDPIFAMTIPGKIQAYLGAGIAIIAMLNGEGADVVLEAEAGLVSPAGDADALAKNVLRLAESETSERVRMGSNGRQFCAANFDRNMLICKLVSLLQDMIKKKESITPE